MSSESTFLPLTMSMAPRSKQPVVAAAPALVAAVIEKAEIQPMLVSRLSIRNFRSIADETFEFERLAVLIGKNNVGKSNVLAAVELLIEGTTKDVAERDFQDKTQPIVLECELKNVRHYLPLCKEEHRTRIANLVLSNDTIRLKRTATASGLGKLEIWKQEEGKFDVLPTGIDAGFKAMLPEPIPVAAFVDPAAQAEGKDSTLAKIVKAILDSIRNDAETACQESLGKVNAVLNVVRDSHTGQESDNRPARLKAIEQSLNAYHAEAFEGSAARIRVEMPELSNLLAKAKVELSDGHRWTEAQLKGQGQQRALYVALLRTLAECVRPTGTSVNKPFILLMEEPEAFLHPGAHVVLRQALEKIAKHNQVLFTTHSPTMVSPNRVGETIMLNRQVTGGVLQATKWLRPLREQLVGRPANVRRLFEYPRSSKFLFASKVLVVEGQSDMELLEAMLARISSLSFDDCGLACVDAADKTQVKDCMDILATQGLLTYGVVDLDFVWRGCGTLLGEDPRYSRFHRSFFDACKAVGYVEADGNRTKDGSKDDARALLHVDFAEDLQYIRTKLREVARIWVLAEGEIEFYAGLSRNAKKKYTEASAAIRSGERAIDHEAEIRELLRWAGLIK